MGPMNTFDQTQGESETSFQFERISMHPMLNWSTES